MAKISADEYFLCVVYFKTTNSLVPIIDKNLLPDKLTSITLLVSGYPKTGPNPPSAILVQKLSATCQSTSECVKILKLLNQR